MIDAAMAEFGRLNAEVERLTQERETAGMAAHDAGVEIDRLQRRVVELEAALGDSRVIQGVHERTADKSLEYATEQRKRAGEAEARRLQDADQWRATIAHNESAAEQLLTFFASVPAENRTGQQKALFRLSVAALNHERLLADRCAALAMQVQAAIEKARQEERERCARVAEEAAPGAPEGPMGDAIRERFRLTAKAIRALKSTKEPNP